LTEGCAGNILPPRLRIAWIMVAVTKNCSSPTTQAPLPLRRGERERQGCNSGNRLASVSTVQQFSSFKTWFFQNPKSHPMARGLAFVVGLCLLAAAIAIPAARHVDDSGADARRGEDAHYPACCARSLIDLPTAAAPHHLAAQTALLWEARGIRSEIPVLLGRQSLLVCAGR